MKPALRFLPALLTNLSCSTIAGTATQEGLSRVVLEKACVLEGKSYFSAGIHARNRLALPAGNPGRVIANKLEPHVQSTAVQKALWIGRRSSRVHQWCGFSSAGWNPARGVVSRC